MQKTYQTVEWYKFPKELRYWIKEQWNDHGKYTYIKWDPLGWEVYEPGDPEYEEGWQKDMKMIKKINKYLVNKEKCNLKKPILILVCW